MDGLANGIGCLLATLTGLVVFFFLTGVILGALILFGVL